MELFSHKRHKIMKYCNFAGLKRYSEIFFQNEGECCILSKCNKFGSEIPKDDLFCMTCGDCLEKRQHNKMPIHNK